MRRRKKNITIIHVLLAITVVIIAVQLGGQR